MGQIDDLLISLLPMIFFIFIIYKIFTSGKKEKEISLINKKIKELSANSHCVNGSIISNKRIEETIGQVQGFSDTTLTKEEFKLSEKQAMYNIVNKTEFRDISAIMNLVLNSSSFDQNGSKFQVSQIVNTGTNVKVGNI